MLITQGKERKEIIAIIGRIESNGSTVLEGLQYSPHLVQAKWVVHYEVVKLECDSTRVYYSPPLLPFGEYGLHSNTSVHKKSTLVVWR